MFKEDGHRVVESLPYWLALSRTPSIGNPKLFRLLEYFQSPENIFQADKGLLSTFSLTDEAFHYFRHPEWHVIEADLRWVEAEGNHFIPFFSPDYPSLLREIPDPPVGLYMQGNKSVLETLQIGIVGSRNPSPSGKRIAHDFARGLTEFGITITSGLAMGIDSAAHAGALAGDGNTIAVLGNGLHTIYPRRNRKLAEKICENGALVSEFPLDYGPIAANFPRRNRIVSGLSVGVLIVEAALRSGSLITAKHALEQGREVFAIPGSIHNPLARGCHALIQQGAKLTEKIRDIVEELGPICTLVATADSNMVSRQYEHEGLDEGTKLLFEYIGYQPVSIDDLIEDTAVQANEIASKLLELELKELIESLPGGKYVRRS